MAEPCIICLENLDSVEPPPFPSASSLREVAAEPALQPEGEPAAAPASPTADETATSTVALDDNIAVIEVCNHTLHDTCLREWIGKANSCPICRQSFHSVQVFDKLGGTLLSSYKVEDRKQVAEFDFQAWTDEHPDEEEEESLPCPVCNLADHEEVLLLCEGCETPYHTYCIGLDEVPHDAWFCMECVDQLGIQMQPLVRRSAAARGGGRRRRNGYFPRTQASMRRARRQARSDDWQGAWGQITGHVFNALNFDLDSNDDDDALEEYRRSQQLRESERREHQRWQQRLSIARRLGAQDIFARNIPQAVMQEANGAVPTAPAQAHPRVQQTREERRAWGALERARECNETAPGTRKRKARSVTGSPVEPAPEPERKPKRPRTRRIGTQGEASSSKSPASVPIRPERNGAGSSSNARSPRANDEPPSFLSSLLREVELSTPSDDENIRSLFGDHRLAVDPSSPGSSPTASNHNSPRAMSTTPPPHRSSLRPSSPTLLSSHIEPIYPPANYSPTRSAGEASDQEQRLPVTAAELRQPRPRRQQPVSLPRSQDTSPTRPTLSLEMKENISSIVRSALKPHWKSSSLTADQYAKINRDVSHKLYDEVADPTAIDEDNRRLWEKKASKEVARAVAELKA